MASSKEDMGDKAMRSYKDTVMNDSEIKEAVLDKCGVKIEVTERDRAIAKAQEVIAHFKGYQEGLERGKKVGKKVGVRAVVGWMKGCAVLHRTVDSEDLNELDYMTISSNKLQAQLKVWGVFNA